jgi:hypothetical protein
LLNLLNRRDAAEDVNKRLTGTFRSCTMNTLKWTFLEVGKEGRMIFEMKAVAEKVEFCVLSERRRSSCMHD